MILYRIVTCVVGATCVFLKSLRPFAMGRAVSLVRVFLLDVSNVLFLNTSCGVLSARLYISAPNRINIGHSFLEILKRRNSIASLGPFLQEPNKMPQDCEMMCVCGLSTCPLPNTTSKEKQEVEIEYELSVAARCCAEVGVLIAYTLRGHHATVVDLDTHSLWQPDVELVWLEIWLQHAATGMLVTHLCRSILDLAPDMILWKIACVFFQAVHIHAQQLNWHIHIRPNIFFCVCDGLPRSVESMLFDRDGVQSRRMKRSMEQVELRSLFKPLRSHRE